MPERPGAGESLALLRKLWRRYDLALSTQSGDRPTLFAWAAGRRSVGLRRAAGLAARLKRLRARRIRSRSPAALHRVHEVLRLAEAIGIAPVAEVVAPHGAMRPGIAPERPYAVIHAAPMFRYKRWTERRLARSSRRRSTRAGLRSWRPAARATSATISTRSGRRSPEVQRLDGALAWPELAALIARRAGLCRARHLGDASRRRDRRADGRALRPDRSAPVGAVAGGRPRPAWDAAGTIQNARQCLAGAEPAAARRPAVPAGGLPDAGSTATASASTNSLFRPSAFRCRRGARRQAMRAGERRLRQWRARLNAAIERHEPQPFRRCRNSPSRRASS